MMSVRYSTKQRHGGAHKWVRTAAEGSEATSTRNDHQPVLKGPRARFIAPKTSWKRTGTGTRTGTKTRSVTTTSTTTDILDAAIRTSSTLNNVTANNDVTKEQYQQLESHKLDLSEATRSAHSTQHEEASSLIQEATLKERILQKLKQKGRNKLILANPIRVVSNENQASQQHTRTTLSEPLASRGQNKLVVKTLGYHKKTKSARLQGSAAKRVKLLHGTKEDIDGMPEQVESSLTDFAYRHTSTLTSTRLIRVRPDNDATPICPTFMRGLTCTNASCRKRHDVPISAGTPICSFFQHQGQCYKGSACPFRHVKVSSQAIVCPNFGTLGFCENPECTMKHVRREKVKEDKVSSESG